MTVFHAAMGLITSGAERHEDGRTVQEVRDALLEAPLATLTAIAELLDEMDKADHADEATGLSEATATWEGGMSAPC